MDESKFIQLCEDVATIRANQLHIMDKLESRPCIQHSTEIDLLKRERWFFGGMAAAITTIISFILK